MPLSREELLAELNRVKTVVNKAINQIVESMEGPKDLIDASFHLILSGGKRVRPFLLIKSAGIFNVSEEYVLPASVSLELLHNFTLIHDDIMDRDEFRRGVKTTHVLYGEPVAIVAGDLLYSLVFKILSDNYPPRLSRKLVNLFSKASIDICMGQTMDLLPEKYISGIEDYIGMIYLKTGALIEASIVGGGIIGGADDNTLSLLNEFGRNIGIAFQIADDILGTFGDPNITGKPVGSDIKNGKMTIVALLALNRLEGESLNLFKSVFGNTNASIEDVKEVIDVLNNYSIADTARDLMLKYYNSALSSLRGLPESRDRDFLEAMARFIVEREM